MKQVSCARCQPYTPFVKNDKCRKEEGENKEEISGGCGGGGPAVPIPSRGGEPTGADGTAMQCGRVGNRLLFRMKSLRFQKIPEAFLCI